MSKKIKNSQTPPTETKKSHEDIWAKLGKLALIVGNHEGVYEVVDGQQRLTTLFLLLSYLGINTGKEDALSFSCRDKSNYTLRQIRNILADERDKYDVDQLQQNISRKNNSRMNAKRCKNVFCLE